jgi:hypothetical protein
MRINLKIMLAIFLIILAAGVVGYNIDFLSGSSGRRTVEADPGESVDPWIDEEPENREAPPPGRPDIPDGNYFSWSGSSPREEVFLPDGGAPVQDSRRPAGGSYLGEEWKNRFWARLLAAYESRREAGRLKDPVGPESGNDESPVSHQEDRQENLFRSQAEKLRILGILYDKNKAAVLMDSGIYWTGDRLPGLEFIVADIGEDQVVFSSTVSGEIAVSPLEPDRNRPPANQKQP